MKRRCLLALILVFAVSMAHAAPQQSFYRLKDKPPMETANMASLRSLVPPASPGVVGAGTANAVYIQGYYTAGDGGGGAFIWDSSNTSDDNGGTVIKPASVPRSSAGRWLRDADPKILNVRHFGALGDTVTKEVAYDAARHSGGDVANYPYTIHEYVSGTDDTAAFQRVASAAFDGCSIYVPAGVYDLANPGVYTYSGTESGGFSVLPLTGKTGITIYGDGDSSVLYTYHNIATWSIRFSMMQNCHDIDIHDLNFDFQAVGTSDASTHPLGANTLTRFGILDFKYDGAGRASTHLNFHHNRVRLNHPEGAYPGKSFTASGNYYDGSTKLEAIDLYGEYAAPASVGGQPPAGTAICEDCTVADNTFLETQARGIWAWMTRRTCIKGNRFVRIGGNRPIVRCQHFNEGLRISDNEVDAENNWKNGSAHDAPLTVSHNNGNYVNKGVVVTKNRIVVRLGAGIQLDGCAGPVIGYNTIRRAAGYANPNTSLIYSGIYLPLPPHYGGADLKGSIADPQIVGNVISDVTNGGIFFKSGSGGLITKNSISGCNTGINAMAASGTLTICNNKISSASEYGMNLGRGASTIWGAAYEVYDNEVVGAGYGYYFTTGGPAGHGGMTVFTNNTADSCTVGSRYSGHGTERYVGCRFKRCKSDWNTATPGLPSYTEHADGTDTHVYGEKSKQ